MWTNWQDRYRTQFVEGRKNYYAYANLPNSHLIVEDNTIISRYPYKDAGAAIQTLPVI